MLEILKYPDPRLKQISKPVTEFNKKLHKFLDEMAVTMYQADGVGLAAPQVGEFVRIFVVDIAAAVSEDGEETEKNLIEFINPKLSLGQGKILFEEGCLSVPGISEEVQRFSEIVVEYQDRHGKNQRLEAKELMAVALQHENDHLDGVLFIDKLSRLKRALVERKLSKAVQL